MDFLGPREVLIALGVLVVLAIVLDIARRIRRNRYENLQMSSRNLQQAPETSDQADALTDGPFPSGGSRVAGIRDEAAIQQVEDSLRRSADVDFGFSKQPQQKQFDLDHSIYQREVSEGSAELTEKQHKVQTESAVELQNQSQEVLVIHLMANKGEAVMGQLLLDSALGVGLRYGAMKIFHRHTNREGSGPVLFSMANLLNPGTFDLNTISDLSCLGVTFFMALDDQQDPVSAFDQMIEAINTMAAGLKLNIMDESRSSMTRQTIDHYRQRARNVLSYRERGH